MGDPCQRFEDQLFEPECELSESQAKALADHLSSCTECQAERELFLESWSALDELEPELEPSPLIRAKVWEQIREDELQTPRLFEPTTVAEFRVHFQRLMVAGLALALGFGLGRGLRNDTTGQQSTIAEATSNSSTSNDFLDPALLELAAQEGYSVEIFPESRGFSPIDQEMMSALAPSDEARTWAETNRGSVIPVTYISRENLNP